ncbi:putative beta-glucosidase btgE [Ophiocordyceps camponoti-floridani]|uniref:Probable beta-glucosidase btgE n=1 Tax=Ophiocordyceps camponoti-floridani TaxID=2030778 RepID=A0A8H4VDP4_9HYPO|nr:putative beta-glucosidase btgE [Ophiocordyceps camponoti-floridani]
MKGVVAATMLAAWTGAVTASLQGHRHGRLFMKRSSNMVDDMCLPGCTTIWKTITGEATLVPVSVPTTSIPKPATTTCSDTTTTAMVTTTSVATTTITIMSAPRRIAVPTPQAQICPTPGTYTLPATTIILHQPTTVMAPMTTQVPAGIHTIGGVTTVVKVATTVTCPVATVVKSGSVTTSTMVQTRYVCPSAGTYTVAPITTSVGSKTVITYPVPTAYSPGTYVADKKVVTVTETGFVYRCPFTTKSDNMPTSAVPTYPAPTSAPAPSAEYPVPSISVISVPVLDKPIPSAPNMPIPSMPTEKHKHPKPAPGKLISDNDHFGITYTPYQSSNGACKSSAEVDRDLSELKRAGFSTVRVYSTDCNALENIGNACTKHDLDMIVGIFVKGTGCSYATPDIKEQVDKLSDWHQWDRVRLVVVGNEAIMNGYCTPQQLSNLITTVKSQCPQYKGPYTVSETLNIWQRPDVSSSLCAVTSVTGANIHPFFNKDVTPQTAGPFVATQLEILRTICPDHDDVINLECGWPTRGKCNGKACPGKPQQAEAIASIRKATGDKTVFFSFQDDLWKKEGECGCEQSWGAASSFSGY